ncbi:hypothetical protein [Candidatus Nitrotoga sp. M5]|uniref:hypothetical protein n=1 Tax=Candidatus Nitrotoga sp. M5 TaxID=2890409 RepID=UPI001EF71FF5|nr:hypothetical protein [Candidatus Nitrotoga sp. M5]
MSLPRYRNTTREIDAGETDILLDLILLFAPFWSVSELTLALTYYINPQGRTVYETSQAMLISGNNFTQLETCRQSANYFLLSQNDARAIFTRINDVIEQLWDKVYEIVELSEVDKSLFWRRQFLYSYSIEE